MTTMNLAAIRDELSKSLRASSVLSLAVRGCTAGASTHTVGVGGETTYTLANLPVRNFGTVTVNGNAYRYLFDYTANFTTGIITWRTALVQGDVVIINYVYGSGDKIYPDLPRDDISLKGSYPRIGIGTDGPYTEPNGLGGMSHMSDILVTIMVAVPANKDSATNGGMGGLDDLEEIHRLIRDAIRSGAKSFYNFQWITPVGGGPLLKGQNDNILKRSCDYKIRFIVE